MHTAHVLPRLTPGRAAVSSHVSHLMRSAEPPLGLALDGLSKHAGLNCYNKCNDPDSNDIVHRALVDLLRGGIPACERCAARAKHRSNIDPTSTKGPIDANNSC